MIEPRKCQQCGNVFTPRERKQKHCSIECGRRTSYQRLGFARNVNDERQDKIRQARREFHADDPRRLPNVYVGFAKSEAGSRDCLADPDCMRPTMRSGMCSFHAARAKRNAS